MSPAPTPSIIPVDLDNMRIPFMKKRTFLALLAFTLAAAAVHIWGDGAPFLGFALALSATVFAAGTVLER